MFEIAYNNGCPVLINNTFIKADIGFKLNYLFIIQPSLKLWFLSSIIIVYLSFRYPDLCLIYLINYNFNNLLIC